VSSLCKNDLSCQLRACRLIRNVVSNGTQQQIQELVNLGVIRILIKILKIEGTHPSLQFESIWCLTDLAGVAEILMKLVISSGV